MYRWVVVVLVAAVAVASSAEAKKKPKPKLPDLVITESALKSKPYLIQDEGNTISYDERTKNVGEGPANVSYTRFGLRQPARSGPRLEIELRRVPALKPGHSHGSSQLSGPFTDDYLVPTGHLGRWIARACADASQRVREADEHNNCKSAGDMDIIPRHLRGPVDATLPGGTDGVTERVHASVTWVFDHVEAPGTYLYGLERADVDYTTSGTDAYGCTHSGHGATTMANLRPFLTGDNLLRITYGSRENTYFAEAYVSNEFHYNVDVTCPDTTGLPYSGPRNQEWLVTGSGTLPLLPAHGYTELSDTYNNSVGGHYDWHFTAH